MRLPSSRLATVLACLQFVVFTWIIPSVSGNASLFYPEDSAVVALSSSDFNKKLMSENTAFLIYYYSSYSKTCIDLASTYQSFAKKSSNWKRIIQFGAVNCGETSNEGLCKEHRILSYPAFKFFGPGAIKSNSQKLYLKKNTEEDLMALTIDSMLFYLSKRTRPFRWPRLSPVEAGTKLILLNEIPFNAFAPTLLIIEDLASYLGVKVILDLSSFAHKVTVLRVTNSEKTLIEELLPNPDEMPVLVRIKRTGEVDLLEKGFELSEDEARHRFVKRITEDFISGSEFEHGFGHNPDQNPSATTTMELTLFNVSDIGSATLSSASPTLPAADNQMSFPKLFYGDLYNGVRQTLYEEVQMYDRLNEYQVNTLKEVLVVFHKYFPVRNENARRFIKRMSEWISHKSRKHIQREDLKAIMKAGSEGFLPQMHPWKSCRNESETGNGYPCSLWLVFHILTVSEYTKERHNLQSRQFHRVLHALRDYVLYFYSFRYPAYNFTEFAGSLNSKLRHPNSSVLWLWETHNRITAIKRERNQGNLTAAGATATTTIATVENSNDVDVDRQFPSLKECPLCRKRGSKTWNTDEVVAFLIKYYNKDNIINGGSPKLTEAVYYRIANLLAFSLTCYYLVYSY